MSIEAPEIQSKAKSGVRNVAVSFAGKLDSGELLTGTPTITEITTSDLTFSSVGVNSAALTINGRSVAISEAVQFKVTGGTADRTYRIRVSATSDSSPAQTLVVIVTLKVEADGT